MEDEIPSIGMEIGVSPQGGFHSIPFMTFTT